LCGGREQHSVKSWGRGYVRNSIVGDCRKDFAAPQPEEPHYRVAVKERLQKDLQSRHMRGVVRKAPNVVRVVRPDSHEARKPRERVRNFFRTPSRARRKQRRAKIRAFF